ARVNVARAGAHRHAYRRRQRLGQRAHETIDLQQNQDGEGATAQRVLTGPAAKEKGSVTPCPMPIVAQYAGSGRHAGKLLRTGPKMRPRAAIRDLGRLPRLLSQTLKAILGDGSLHLAAHVIERATAWLDLQAANQMHAKGRCHRRAYLPDFQG